MVKKANVMLIVAVVLWGITIAPTKWALETLHPFTLTFLRLLIASVFFLPYAWSKAKSVSPSFTIPWSRMAMLSFTGVAGYFLFGYSGIALTSGVNASILSASLSLFTLLLAAIYLKEAITAPQWFGLLMGVIGVLFISIQPEAQSGSSLVGDVLVLVSSFIFAAYVVLLKRPKAEAQLPSELFTALTLSISGVMILPFAVAEVWVYGLPVFTTKVLISLVFLVFGSTIMAYWLWNKGLESSSAAQAGVYLNALPLVSVVSSIALLGEAVTWRTLIGGSLVLLGVFYAEKKRKPHREMMVSAE